MDEDQRVSGIHILVFIARFRAKTDGDSMGRICRVLTYYCSMGPQPTTWDGYNFSSNGSLAR